MFLNLKLKITKAVLLLLVLNVFSPALSVMAETLSDKDIVFEKSENLYYSKLMREVRLIKEGKADNTKEAKLQAINDLERFIGEEKTRLEKLGVDKEKQKKYFELLELQLTDVKSKTDVSLDEFEKVTEFYKETVLPLGESLDSVKELQYFDSAEEVRVKNLEEPSTFHFGDEEVTVESLSISDSGADEKISQAKQSGTLLRSLFGIGIAYAIDIQFMPVLEDLEENDEVIISSSIRNLAHDLNNNPVEIFNYVRNNITYEPYFGAKKGSVGCLQERVCNDVDTASLTIALMRAAGIPARYKKGLAVIPVEQLQNLLGVDETKTVYYAFYANNVPVYTLSGSQNGVNIDLADFTYETHLVLDWVNVEIFYDYDERGANIPNIMDLSEAATTQDLQALFTDSDKKQWIPVDAAIKVYDRTQNEIVHDTANFDTMAFWLDFLQYQGDLSPIAKYIQDLLTQTGSDITLAQYQSTKEIQPRQFDILPSSLPYEFAEGTPNGGDPILFEAWSELPNDHRYQVTLSLLHESDSSVVFSNTFFGSEINNKGVDLMYQGATPADEAVIESYGGIHATPAALVDIQPYFLTDSGRYEGASDVTIGESLILQFEYSVGGNLIYTDQKYSVAGNQEGIYMVLSKVLDNPYFTDGLNDNSEILLEGNTGLAWKYIREVEADSDLLAKALDYEYNLEFFRAVVTQNRVLTEVGGVPTTFDFEGLTIDASSYINDYSNRGNFREHQEDFRLLWGENASYYEAQLFTDVAGLEGISTVKGLQYAYANLGTYTVHTIDSGNESVIDTLTLSANTKANMHADVQAGNTIITPDKPVVRENFDGSLYISLDPEGTGTYAIGEQVANGAWTTDEPQDEQYIDENSNPVDGYSVPLIGEEFYFEDGENMDGIMCRIPDQDQVTILQRADWQEAYGQPCLHDEMQFGSSDHEFILASNASYFKSIEENYDTWEYKTNIGSLMDSSISNSGLSLPNPNSSSLAFNPEVGTYEMSGTYGAAQNVMSYFEPSNSGGEGHIVYEEVLDKYRIDLSFSLPTIAGLPDNVSNIMGFPTGDQSTTMLSGFGTTGKYQTFVGGTIYFQDDVFSYYVPGYLRDYHDGRSATSGTFGFPVHDPKYSTDGNSFSIKQDFEGTRIMGTGTISGDTIMDTLVSETTHLPVWYRSEDYLIPGELYTTQLHYLIIELDPNLENRACFKHVIDLEGINIGTTDGNGDIIKQFYNNDKGRVFREFLNASDSSSIYNRTLNGHEPIAGVNGDYFEKEGSLLNINYSMGYDYSGDGHCDKDKQNCYFWTSMSIEQDNDVLFSIDEANFPQKHNIIGGGPPIIKNGSFTTKSCLEMFGLRHIVDSACFFHDERTIIGVTQDNSYMIMLIAEDGPWELLEGMINMYSSAYGSIYNANMFDGGGSSSIMFEGDIKETDKPLKSLLMVYQGDACTP